MLFPVTEYEVRIVNNNSVAINVLSNNIVKKYIDEIVRLMTISISASFESRVFPELFKIARVLPLLKKED